MLNVLADENMPYVAELFGDFSTIVFKSGREMTAADLVDVDVLLIRSITQVNRDLLAQANALQWVGSATIGTDHLDINALEERGIGWSNAPGCNAVAVAQYVLSALLNISHGKNINLTDKTMAIVGAGNIGQQVAVLCEALSIKYFFCDPLVQATGQVGDFRSLDEVLTADIISLHVPMTTAGDYPTYHLFDAQRLAKLRPDAILINSCRGDVIDNKALLSHLELQPQFSAIIDVWQHEPTISLPLLERVSIATAHIAGYSLEGKARGTFMLYQQWCQRKNQPITKSVAQLLPTPTVANVTLTKAITLADIKQLVNLMYDPRDDDNLLRGHGKSAKGFDNLRKQYKVRRELSAITVYATGDDDVALLSALGFNSVKI